VRFWFDSFIRYFANEQADCENEITEVLKHIETLNLLTPIQVIQMLSVQEKATLSVVRVSFEEEKNLVEAHRKGKKEFIVRTLQEQSQQMEEDASEIRKCKEETRQMRLEIEELTHNAKVREEVGEDICFSFAFVLHLGVSAKSMFAMQAAAVSSFGAFLVHAQFSSGLFRRRRNRMSDLRSQNKSHSRAEETAGRSARRSRRLFQKAGRSSRRIRRRCRLLWKRHVQRSAARTSDQRQAKDEKMKKTLIFVKCQQRRKVRGAFDVMGLFKYGCESLYVCDFFFSFFFFFCLLLLVSSRLFLLALAMFCLCAV
jgi:hypothetical protein